MSSSVPPASLCLVRLSALGDVIMVLALVRHLQTVAPETRLTWVCGRAVEPLLRPLAAEGVELIPIDKPRGLRDYWAVRQRLAGRRFSALLALQANWRTHFLYPMIAADRVIGYGPDRAKDGHRWFVREALPPAKPHLVDGFLQFAEALGLPWPQEVHWRFPLPTAALAAVRERLGTAPYWVLSPCSSKAERDWPVERFAAVARVMAARAPLRVVLLGGRSPREQAFAAALQSAAPEVAWVNWVGQTSLEEWVAVIAGARAVLAPDTGAVHLARAVGVPVCGLYAVAPTSRTGPYQAYGACVDKFAEAARLCLGRDPAELPWGARVHDPRAMALITVEDVVEKLAPLLV